MSVVPRIYDFNLDRERDVTQRDVDELLSVRDVLGEFKIALKKLETDLTVRLVQIGAFHANDES